MVSVQKIVFIKDTRFTERDFERFGREILKKNKFEVEYWDVSPVFYKEADKSGFLEMQKKYSEYQVIHSMDELQSSLLAIGRTTWIHMLIPLSWNSFKIYRTLSKNNNNYSVQTLGALPIGKLPDQDFWSPVLKKMKKIPKLSAKRIFLSFFNRFLLKNYHVFGIKPVPVCLLGGEKAQTMAEAVFPIDSTTSFVWVHAHDYDTYLNVRDDNDRMYTGNYGVFLDSNLPFHPDYQYSGEIPTCCEHDYFPALKRFFLKIKEKTGYEVLIAAHPTSGMDQYLKHFDKDLIFWGKTADLIHNAKFVLNHQSTTINFAILFNKPVIFLTNDAIDNSLIGPEITVMAVSINKTVINIDKPFTLDFNREMRIDQSAYEKYMKDYIKTPGSPELPIWQIVADYLKNRT